MTELLNNHISQNQTPEAQTPAPEVVDAVEAPLYMGRPIPCSEQEIADIYRDYQEEVKSSKGKLTPEAFVDDLMPIYEPTASRGGVISKEAIDVYEENKRMKSFALGMTRLSPDRFALARGYMFPKSNEQRQMIHDYAMNVLAESKDEISVEDYINHANASSPDGQFAKWLNADALLKVGGTSADKIRKVSNFYNDYIDSLKPAVNKDEAVGDNVAANVNDNSSESPVGRKDRQPLTDFESYRSMLADADAAADEAARVAFQNADTQPMPILRPISVNGADEAASFGYDPRTNAPNLINIPVDGLNVQSGLDSKAAPVVESDSNELDTNQAEALAAAREAFAAASAKRQRKLFKGGRSAGEYLATEENYYAALQNSNSSMIDKLLAENPEASVGEVFEKTLRNTLDDEIAVRERSVEMLNNTLVGKAINWISAPGKSRLNRFMRGAAVSAGVGLLAGALTVSTGGAAVAVGATVGARGGLAAFKTFAKRIGRDGRGVKTELDHDKLVADMKDRASSKYDLDDRATVANSRDLARLAMGTRKRALYEDVDSVIDKNQGAAAAGTLGAIAGGIGGHYAGEFIGSYGGEAVEWTKDKISGALGRIASLGDIFSGDDHSQIFETTPGPEPNVGGVNEMPTPIELPKPSFSDLAMNIELGEGMNQTIAETLGRNDIPGYVLNDIVRELGPKFETMNLTYAMGDGSYGWSRTGELSNEALTMIQQAAEARGYSVVR